MRIRVSGERYIGDGEPCFIVAEMSANHRQDFDRALKIVRAAADVGADAVKLQTYTPDTITVDSEEDFFRISGDSLWAGKSLYNLYKEACMPWEWQPKLKEVAEELGLVFFSTPFDPTAVDFLEEMDVSLYKIASFEIVDLPLIRYVARKKKPVIMSTGMASLGEIDEAVRTVRCEGNEEIALLKCVSAYPAPFEEMNLRTIGHLRGTFHCPAGLSDHTLGDEVAIAAVSIGAKIIEKHFTLSRAEGGLDAPFSMEPDEFEKLVKGIRTVEKALGEVSYEPTEKEMVNKRFRRSLFAVKDIKKGEQFNEDNIRSIRPAAGLSPKHLKSIIGREAACDIKSGSPMKWEYIKKTNKDIN